MFKFVTICSGVLGLAVAFGSGGAVAQSMSTTNCVAVGPNLVHCDTIGMAPTVSPPGPAPEPCNNAQNQQALGDDPYAGQSKTRKFFGTLGDALLVGGGRCPAYLPRLQQEQLTKFRMQVGKLLADGDCQGAARFALGRGALELGQSIMAACHPDSTSVTPAAQPPALPLGQPSVGADVTTASIDHHCRRSGLTSETDPDAVRAIGAGC